jgi:hypothetical protein
MQKTASCSIQSATTGFIANIFPYRNRVSLKEAFEGPEPYDGKLSRPVLRGPAPSNGGRLLGEAIFRQTPSHRAMVPYTGRFVNLHPHAVKLVLDSGHTVGVDVAGTSMTPTLERGTRVTVGPTTEDLRPGDIVLILTANEAELVLHRVIRLFTVGGQQFVIHQGDAPTSAFDTCRREAVLGQAVGFPVTPERALPTLDVLDAAALTQFERRRRLSLLYSLGRKVMFRLRGINPALARGLVRMYREYLVR